MLCRPLLQWSPRAVPPRALIRAPFGPARGARPYTTAAAAGPADSPDLTSRTRNIGIIAHIDAGKTTTTERMLYYSGHTRRIGSVDDGSTVTDFLPTERQRGITIQSAAITFHWPPPDPAHPVTAPDEHPPGTHVVNLIDTPGHADFTFEVLRALRVLDGAVCILDGVAGVEAQTEQVWRQARGYRIPALVYVNKLDRAGAGFGRCVRDVAAKLGVAPAVCQVPWYEPGGERFRGVVDVVRMRGLRWPTDGDGKVHQEFDLAALEAEDARLAGEAKKARAALVELLSDHDDVMLDKFLDCADDPWSIPASEILASLRRCTLRNPSPIVPVLAGSSLRNIGVQPLLDAITAILPHPNEAADPEITAGAARGHLGDLVSGKLQLPAADHPKPKQAKNAVAAPAVLEACALAFKVVNDSKRGMLVYVRVYHGALRANALLYNTNLQTTEKVPRLLRMYAADATVISHIPAGQIGVIPGLKHARTGDTLIACPGMNPKKGPAPPLNELQLRPIDVPPPVFFTGIEPESRSEERNVAEALAVLLREDPSLQLSVDEDTGQQLLSGMGELHLEIARDHLVRDLKARASVGRIEVGYRESITAKAGPVTRTVEREVAGAAGKAACTVRVRPRDERVPDTAGADGDLERDGNVIQLFVKRPAGAPSLSAERCLPKDAVGLAAVGHALQTGALAALASGPGHRCPVVGAAVAVTLDPAHHLFGAASTPAVLAAAARAATRGALRASAQARPPALVEPMMLVRVRVDEPSLGDVVHDLSAARSGQVLAIDDDAGGAAEGGDEGAGRIDVRKVYAPPDPYESPGAAGLAVGPAALNRQRQITARVPLQEMVGYLKHLRSLTAGRGTFVMSVDRFEKMSPQREKALLKEWSGGL